MRKLKRRMINNPSAILTADWHIRPDTPVCRTDDFLTAQETKLKFIVDLAKKYNCPILIAGDIGNRHQWPNWLLEWFVRMVTDVNIIAIPGQHDLPGHRIDELRKSAQGVLSVTDTIDLRTKIHINLIHDFVLISFPYSRPIKHLKQIKIKKEDLALYKSLLRPKVAITHQMVIEDKPLWPGQEAPRGHQLLKKYPEYDLILSGDNHNPFVSEYKGRILVNPGSITRTTAAQINHKPRVYLWFDKTNKVEPVYLQISKGVVSREHIEEEGKRDERLCSYVKHMKTDYEIGFSFEGNLERHIETNKVNEEVKDKTWKMVE